MAQRKRKPKPQYGDAARARSASMGPVVEVEAAGFRSDGGPELVADQVFVTPTGLTFHAGWCDTVGQIWDEHPGRLFVIARDTVGLRRPSRECEPDRPAYGRDLVTLRMEDPGRVDPDARSVDI